jgi:hypothetical protein
MPTAYLRKGCPFSFKFLLFVSEAGLRDLFDIVIVDPESARMKEVKEKLERGTGKKMTFPTVEIEPNIYKSDSDALIAHYSEQHRVDANSLPALSFYKDSILPQLEELHS